MQNNDSLVGGLHEVRDKMLARSQQNALEGDWSGAEQLMRYARELDAMAKGLAASEPRGGRLADGGGVGPPQPMRSRGNGKLPYYYVEGDRLAKVGPSRDGSTYEHRVPREHFDIVVAEIERIGVHSGTFATASLVDRCPIPKHEPLIVVAVLAESGCLRKIRRGHWAIVDRDGIRADAEAAWARLPRESYA